MGYTIYATEREKFDLLSNTVYYIWNNIDPKLTENDPIKTREYFESDKFSQFKGEIESARRIYKNSDDIHRGVEHVTRALHLWEFGLQFAIPVGKEKAYAPKFKKFGWDRISLPGEDLSNRVILLRQMVDLLKRHIDDVWIKEDDQGRVKLYNTRPDRHIKHEHFTKRPEKPKEPERVGVESTESQHLDALLLQLHVLSKRDI